jgi:8-oxo-dGTP pyrophosphatase MutT (NUDIX family)
VSQPAPGFTRLAEREVYRSRLITVAVGTFRGPDGRTFERDVVHHIGAVAVVPLVDEDRVLMVRQYRAPIDAWLLEIPAGVRDVGGEPPEQTAARELVEEVGHRAGRLERLCSFHNSAGWCDEQVQIYLATDIEATATARQGIEEDHMTIEEIALDDVDRLIVTGELTDAKSIIGLGLTQRRLGR